MKQSLTVTMLTVLMLINITGCSVVRFAETRMGYGLKKANKTRMDLDFQLGFNVTDRSLRVTLEHQPHAIYKPDNSHRSRYRYRLLGAFGKGSLRQLGS